MAEQHQPLDPTQPPSLQLQPQPQPHPQPLPQPQPLPLTQPQTPGSPAEELMASYVAAMEAALLPCLPARELQAIDRSAHSSHQIDVERHARDFMEAAKKLQIYFLSLQHDDQPSKKEMLQREIAMMEAELKAKTELIEKHEARIQEWRNELKDQSDKHILELEKV